MLKYLLGQLCIIVAATIIGVTIAEWLDPPRKNTPENREEIAREWSQQFWKNLATND